VTLPAPVAVTGAGGRLGRALVAELATRGVPTIAWSRPDYDLDDPAAADRLVARDRPALVIHAAAWTDVDGCARQPELAERRNASAVGELAKACAESGVALVLISTNEVFDGQRTDGQGYLEDDSIAPANPYGTSKLAGEVAAREAFAASGSALWIVRTAWLYGPPGNDFPTKILAAADRLAPGDPLKVVSDEIGSPTYAPDLAAGIVDLVSATSGGTFHLAGADIASRYDFAAAVLELLGPGRALAPISRSEFIRASNPPAWAVLDCSSAAGFGVRLRPWQEALVEYLAPRAS
jgi:dTDP-4-dehydrorhamnose reductase